MNDFDDFYWNFSDFTYFIALRIIVSKMKDMLFSTFSKYFHIFHFLLLQDDEREFSYLS